MFKFSPKKLNDFPKTLFLFKKLKDLKKTQGFFKKTQVIFPKTQFSGKFICCQSRISVQKMPELQVPPTKTK